jgi:hypothetical protein
VEDLERSKSKVETEFSEETKEIKREKRRLNDLLTLREEEIERMKESEKGRSKMMAEKEAVMIEVEKKMKHMEKKYEKTI